MKLTRFLNEDIVDEVRKDIVPTIKKDCQPYLKARAGAEHWLMRGSKSINKVFAKVKTRTDRVPKDTPLRAHKLMDEVFKKRFGWKPRSEGVFVFTTSTSRAQIKFYGEAYLLYPIGRFEFVWSPTIFDLTDALRNNDLIGKDGSKYYFPNTTEKWWKEEFEEKILHQYSNMNFKQALLHDNEMMIKCKEYYMLQWSEVFPLSAEIARMLYQ